MQSWNSKVFGINIVGGIDIYSYLIILLCDARISTKKIGINFDFLYLITHFNKMMTLAKLIRYIKKDQYSVPEYCEYIQLSINHIRIGLRYDPYYESYLVDIMYIIYIPNKDVRCFSQVPFYISYSDEQYECCYYNKMLIISFPYTYISYNDIPYTYIL